MRKSPLSGFQSIARSGSSKLLLNGMMVIAMTMVVSNAATVSDSVSFTINETYGAVSETQQVFDTNFLTAPVQQFDTTMGTLESFTITWTLAGTYTGSLSTGGGVSSAYNGPFLVNDIGSTAVPSASGGGGFGGGGGPGTVIALPFTGESNPLSFTQTFLVSDAGVNYAPEVLAAVLGSGTVPLRWNTPLAITGNWSNLSVTGTGSATILYTYAVPEASSFALGLIALGSSCALRKRR